jgi:phospholipid/cholesterol/gamma-HCH transport system substrate-binding protein
MRDKNVETFIGISVIIFCITILSLVYSRGYITRTEGDFYTLNASFERVDGINIGNEVMISGVKVGEVKSKKLDHANYNALVTISIEKDIQLPVDTSAEIVSASLMGDKYISLVPGAESEFLKDGDRVEFTQSSISIEALITKFVFGMDTSKESSDIAH